MKRCPNCAKEIGYDTVFCCDKCLNEHNEFHQRRERFQSVFSVFNGIFVLGIGISIFLYSFVQDVGTFMGAGCLLLLGVLYTVFPFPAEVMIERFKLRKALFMTRIIAAVIFLIGVVVLVLALLGIL